MYYFDAHAEKYGGRTFERFRDVPNFIVKNIKDGSLILDIGCGKGEFLSYVNSKFNCTAFGIDISRKMLSSHNCRTTIVQSDATMLPFKSDTFDVVYMDTIIHHIVASSYFIMIQLQKEAIIEAIRVLKPHGYLIIQELYYDFLLSTFKHFAFWWLKIANKINIPPFPGETSVVIYLRTKKDWDLFMGDFQKNYGLILIKRDVYPASAKIKFRLLGVKEIGNAVYFLQKPKNKVDILNVL